MTPKGKRAALIAAGALAGVLAIGGVAAAVGGADGEGDGDGDGGRVDQSQVKISTVQAEQAAVRAVPGTATGTRLESEAGTTVYAVTVSQPSGQVATVDVRASDGTLLKTESGADGGDGGDGGDEGGDEG